MKNFEYRTPTKLFFGKGQIEVLPEELNKIGKKVLLCYGGGSIKKIGLYDKIKELLKDFNVVELSGIEPNPKYSSVKKGAEICKSNNIDVVLAVGGGSVIDCAKAISACACYDGEGWNLITYKVPTLKALPIASVLTLSATGSEYDWGAVISKPDSLDKVGYIDEHLFPTFSILDPEYTFSVPKNQTSAGAVDIFNHVLEQFFAEGSFLADKMCESVLKTVIKYTPIALNNPFDYEARAQLMLASSFGCNGILSLGNGASGWPCHGMEHALSGYYDITHGVGLAIITPRWMKYILNEKTLDRFVAFGVGVFDIDASLNKMEIAKLAIQKTYDFFESINVPMTLKEVGIGKERIAEMAKHIAENEGLENAYAPLTEKDIENILTDCL